MRSTQEMIMLWWLWRNRGPRNVVLWIEKWLLGFWNPLPFCDTVCLCDILDLHISRLTSYGLPFMLQWNPPFPCLNFNSNPFFTATTVETTLSTSNVSAMSSGIARGRLSEVSDYSW